MENPMYYRYYQSKLGRMLVVASKDAITGLYFTGQKYYKAVEPSWIAGDTHEPLTQCARELDEYFAGKRTTFTFRMDPQGTAFQRAVWRGIASVPYGETISYAQLSRRVGAPANARAAGTATGRNPISIAIPCHRIVGSNGNLTGYAGGLDKKSALLDLESHQPALLPH
jgi:methylated-DNA-[protein]-cysteine S-methyltransferase